MVVCLPLKHNPPPLPPQAPVLAFSPVHSCFPGLLDPRHRLVALLWGWVQTSLSDSGEGQWKALHLNSIWKERFLFQTACRNQREGMNSF